MKKKSTSLENIKIPDISTLQRIRAFSGLNEGHLISLANQLRIGTAKKKEFLIRKGANDNDCIFLVQGRVSLVASDGQSKIVSSDDAEEIKPVAQLRPSIYDVLALEPVTYIKINKQKLADIEQSFEVDIGEISLHSLFDAYDEEEGSVVKELWQKLIDGSIHYPSLPSVAERVQHIYKGEETDKDEMVKILSSYPDVAKLISAFVGNAKNEKLGTTDKLFQVIKKRGIETVYTLVMMYSIGRIFSRQPAPLFKQLISFWKNSIAVAAVSRVLAERTKTISPDRAMLAGMVHGIGELVIWEHLLNLQHHMLDQTEVKHVVRSMRPEISALVLRKWQFSDEVVVAAEECEEWSRNEDGVVDVGDLVLLANYINQMARNMIHSLPPVTSIPAMKKLDLKPDELISTIKKSKVVKSNIKKHFF
jgi:HD-like signal output (HDOD) protein